MTPTNLSALSSNLPIPNARVQIKRGTADAAANVNTSTPGGTGIYDANSNLMGITYTPRYPCFWVVHSNIMAHGYPDGTGWRRWDHGIYISPADADGVTLGFQCPHELYDNSTVEWRTVGGSAMFRLQAGVGYTAYLAHAYITAGTAQYHVGQQWCRIVGRIVGEGAI